MTTLLSILAHLSLFTNENTLLHRSVQHGMTQHFLWVMAHIAHFPALLKCCATPYCGETPALDLILINGANLPWLMNETDLWYPLLHVSPWRILVLLKLPPTSLCVEAPFVDQGKINGARIFFFFALIICLKHWITFPLNHVAHICILSQFGPHGDTHWNTACPHYL